MTYHHEDEDYALRGCWDTSDVSHPKLLRGNMHAMQLD